MPKAEPDAGNDAQLAADVRAFAAQLGLGSGSGDGAFDDFAPQKASQRIGGAKAKPAKQQQQQNGGGGGAAAAAGRRRQDDGKPQQQGGKAREQQQQQGGRWQKDGGKPHGRDGRDGKQQQQQQYQQRRPWQQPGGGYGEVPPAPEVPNAKSIMPKDEPTVWHEAASTLPPLAPAAGEAAPELVQQLRKRAERLLLVEEQVGGCTARVDECGALGGWKPVPALRCAAAAAAACVHSVAVCMHGASTPRRRAAPPLSGVPPSEARRGGCCAEPLGSVEAPRAHIPQA